MQKLSLTNDNLRSLFVNSRSSVMFRLNFYTTTLLAPVSGSRLWLSRVSHLIGINYIFVDVLFSNFYDWLHSPVNLQIVQSTSKTLTIAFSM